MKDNLPKYNMFDRIEAYDEIIINSFIYVAHISVVIIAIKVNGMNSEKKIYLYDVVKSLDRPGQIIENLVEHKIVGLTDIYSFPT